MWNFPLAVTVLLAAVTPDGCESEPRHPPHLDPDEWWGLEDARGHRDTSIRPFRIKFDDEMIADLRYRLKHHRRFTPPLAGVNFRYGFNSDVVEGFLQYWANGYDFKQQEAYLNQFPQFKTNIQGLDVHFIWVKPQVPPGVEVVPLLMLHGWPGSIREFYHAIPIITAVRPGMEFAVELIVPSIPGFGWSDGTFRPGLGSPQMAVIMRNLMHRLGHKQFYIQGGDFGSIIHFDLATLYPNDVLGFHSNFAVSFSPKALLIYLLGSWNPSLVVDPALEYRMYPLKQKFSNTLEETGYLHEQATKPDTIGFSFSDSPAGLLTYILEKFSSGTNGTFRDLPDGGLKYFNPTALIDNLMMYWAPNSMTTAMRLYAETFNKRTIGLGLRGIPSPVPFWAIHAENEIYYQSPVMLKVKFPNMLNATVIHFAGHFLAFERPDVFSADVLKALAEFRKWNAYNRDYSYSQWGMSQGSHDSDTVLHELLDYVGPLDKAVCGVINEMVQQVVKS